MELDEVKKLNIFERVALITAEIGSVTKDLKVGEGEKSYQATSEGSVLSAVKPLEEKYRVFSYAVTVRRRHKSLRRNIPGTDSSGKSAWSRLTSRPLIDL